MDRVCCSSLKPLPKGSHVYYFFRDFSQNISTFFTIFRCSPYKHREILACSFKGIFLKNMRPMCRDFLYKSSTSPYDLKGLSVIVHSKIHFCPNSQICLHIEIKRARERREREREIHCSTVIIYLYNNSLRNCIVPLI